MLSGWERLKGGTKEKNLVAVRQGRLLRLFQPCGRKRKGARKGQGCFSGGKASRRKPDKKTRLSVYQDKRSEQGERVLDQGHWWLKSGPPGTEAVGQRSCTAGGKERFVSGGPDGEGVLSSCAKKKLGFKMFITNER